MKAIIIGATSGIGQEVAKLLVQQGWHIGIAGRREEALRSLQATAPAQIEIEKLDVTEPDAPEHLHRLIGKLGDMDLFFLSSGVGNQNRDSHHPLLRRTSSAINNTKYNESKNYTHSFGSFPGSHRLYGASSMQCRLPMW